jgi:hypothetical protein
LMERIDMKSNIQINKREREKRNCNERPRRSPCALSPGRTTAGRPPHSPPIPSRTPPSPHSPSVHGTLTHPSRSPRLGRLVFRPPRPPTTGGPPAPAPPYVRCRSLRRRRAPTRYPHPSLPFLLCEAEYPNPNLKLFGYLIVAS